MYILSYISCTRCPSHNAHISILHSPVVYILSYISFTYRSYIYPTLTHHVHTVIYILHIYPEQDVLQISLLHSPVVYILSYISFTCISYIYLTLTHHVHTVTYILHIYPEQDVLQISLLHSPVVYILSYISFTRYPSHIALISILQSPVAAPLKCLSLPHTSHVCLPHYHLHFTLTCSTFT